MGNLKRQLEHLELSIKEVLETKIERNGIDTGHTIEKGLKVRGEYYIERREVQYITENVVVAGGLNYNHTCIGLEELIEIVENL